MKEILDSFFGELPAFICSKSSAIIAANRNASGLYKTINGKPLFSYMDNLQRIQYEASFDSPMTAPEMVIDIGEVYRRKLKMSVRFGEICNFPFSVAVLSNPHSSQTKDRSNDGLNDRNKFAKLFASLTDTLSLRSSNNLSDAREITNRTIKALSSFPDFSDIEIHFNENDISADNTTVAVVNDKNLYSRILSLMILTAGKHSLSRKVSVELSVIGDSTEVRVATDTNAVDNGKITPFDEKQLRLYDLCKNLSIINGSDFNIHYTEGSVSLILRSSKGDSVMPDFKSSEIYDNFDEFIEGFLTVLTMFNESR